MTRLIVARHEALLCAALEDSSGVHDLYAMRQDVPEQAGAVVQATVTRVLSGQNAAIVRWDSGEGYWSDAGNAKAGDTARLQIKSAAYADKLPQLARDIALPGRFLLHLPQGKGVKLSRQAKGDAVPEGLSERAGGWVVRHAAATATAEQVAGEAAYLQALGQQQPAIAAPTVWQRALIEHGAVLQAIVVDDAATERTMRGWLTSFAPDLLPLITRAADVLDWDALIAEATSPQVSLAEGATLTIEPTRAFWAVDVDAGAARNPLQVNILAARALARQMRLRNMGGVVVVDFITLPTPALREQLLTALRQATTTDPAGVEIFGLSKLGLVEMTRTRRGKAVQCVVCDGM